jgi:hypothetical protein
MRPVRAWFAVCLAAAAPVAAAGDVRGGRPDPVTSAGDARALAARIDAALAAQWAKAGVRPVAVADDGEFLRRVCLDLIGKIPTAAEARDFLDDPSPDKRLALVDRLLDSPAYTTRATELWRQLLLPEADTEDLARQVVRGFEAWLRRRVAEEAGYDKIAHEVLTAALSRRADEPLAVRDDPSPSAYYVAKEGSPEKIAASVARVFLGVRLECAQCHNHPFAPWKRDQFWGFAAFFAGVPAVSQGDAVSAPRAEGPRRELTIPGTNKVVRAGHLDGSPPAWRPRADSRTILSEWITAPGNPYFDRAVVNRVWARFFGVGLIEPVDDLAAEGGSEFSGLVDELAAQFRSHGYDLKFLIRALTATRAYNLTSAGGEAGGSASPSFAAMPVRGLSPEQFLNSLVQATGTDLGETRGRLLDLFANRDERSTEAQTSILQALTMMNGAYIAAATDPETGNVLGAVARAPFLDTPGRIETLYLATLTRRPKPEELEALVEYVDRQKDEGARAKVLGDVFWALLNGPEFHLNH